VFRHVDIGGLNLAHAPGTLEGACGSDPGIACRLVWDVSGSGQAAELTRVYFAGPINLVLRIVFVVALALAIRAVLHRVINRVTDRAANTVLPRVHSGARSWRLRRRQRVAGETAGTPASPATPVTPGKQPATPETVTPAADGGQEATAHSNGSAGRQRRKAAAPAPDAAALAEHALVAERRHQRVHALGSILRNAASVTIFGIAGVVILGDLGINLAPLLASAGVVGIAIGFGAQNLVRDYLSGIFMLLEDQYGVGDVISIGHATGTVETVNLRTTRMRDVNGIVWHIRNGTIDQVGNESQGWARAVIDFPVPYEADLSKIRVLLERAAEGMWRERYWRKVLLEKPEVWGAQKISSSEVTMRMVARTAPLRQWEVERELRARIKAALDAAGIQPPPQVLALTPAALPTRRDEEAPQAEDEPLSEEGAVPADG
jgi:small-conductance mechanosensitive channel